MAPSRFSSMSRAWDSSGMSSKGPHMLVPALLTHTSIPLKAHAALLASSRVWAGSVTSVGTASARPPSASQSRAACSSSSRRLAARTTLAPRRAKAWAVASPMLLEAPVITTVASRRLLITVRLPFHPQPMRCQLHQPHLFGILDRINGLGLELLSVEALPEDAHPGPERKPEQEESEL